MPDHPRGPSPDPGHDYKRDDRDEGQRLQAKNHAGRGPSPDSIEGLAKPGNVYKVVGEQDGARGARADAGNYLGTGTCRITRRRWSARESPPPSTALSYSRA